MTTTAAAGTPWAPAAAATAQPSPSASPVDATGPAASASPSPSSSALARLATTYGRLSTVANPEIRSCVNHAANVTTLAQAKAAARLCHDRVAGSIAAFHDTDWGPLTAQAATLDAAIARVDGLLVQMQRAPTLKAFLAAYDQLGPALTTLRSDANRLRAALGLPPVPASAFT
ncbi:MAG TPA: hypothetical protein VMT50_01960 [Steroidobacteraceae bacterium]|nr:hypothetical protein [Steroidobacteraceae bacterium]